jgi:hypothetical protein
MKRENKVLIPCIVFFIFCAVASSNAGSELVSSIATLLIAAIWILIWTIRFSFAYLNSKKSKAQKLSASFWAIEPTCILLTLLVIYAGLFSLIRFSLSENALSQYAADVRSGKINVDFEFFHEKKRIGLYQLTITEHLSDGTVRFITSSHNLLDSAGFANSESNPPMKRGEDSYKHIYGNWWVWYRSW